MSEQTNLLLVEDDDPLAELLIEYLTPHGFAISRVASGDDGVRSILEEQPDIVILDLMLPGINGLDVCKQVRDTYAGVIIMLTASQSDTDHVVGLELGADDFVTKPIEPRVLLARIRTQLRRRGDMRVAEESRDDDILELGSLRIDMESRRVHFDATQVDLTAMEFDVLSMLANQVGSVVERDELYSDILGIEYDGLDRGMDVHVSRIRRKLQTCGFDPSRLKSVRGVGYLLTNR